MFKTKKNVFLGGILFFLFFVFPNESWSQKERKIELTKTQKAFILNEPTEKVDDSLLKIYNSGKYDLLFSYSDYYVNRGKQGNNSNILYVANYYLSLICFYIKKDYKNALHYSDATLKAAEQLEDRDPLMRSLQLQGGILYELGKYQDALDNYYKNLKLARELDLVISEIRTKVFIGNIKIRLNEYTQGEDIYKNILHLLEQDGYRKEFKSKKQYNDIYINALNGLGICQRDNNSLAALETFKRGIFFLEKETTSNNEEFVAMIHTNLGKAYSNLNDYNNAMNYLNRADKFLSEGEYKSNVYFQNVLFKAEVLKNQGNIRNALQILEEGFQYLNPNEYPPKLLDMLDLAIILCQELSDIKKENVYRKQRTRITDTIHENDVATRVLENQELSNENKELSSKNEVTTTTLKRTLMLVGILSLFLLVLGVFYFRNINQNKKKFDALIQKMDKAPELQRDLRPRITITDEKTDAILQKLQKLENNSFFIHKDCTLHNTAKRLKTNTTYLSKIINTHKQKTFNEYLNELRINYVLGRIRDSSKFRLYTISAIADELGYKSTNTFTNAFKKYTGLKPSFYIKQIERNLNS